MLQQGVLRVFLRRPAEVCGQINLRPNQSAPKSAYAQISRS